MATSSTQTTEAADLRQPTEAASLPMAVAAYLTSLAGLHALNVVYGDPAFAALTVALLTVGSVISYAARALRIAPNPLELPAIALFGVVCLMVVGTNDVLPLVTPTDVAEMHGNRIGLFLAWFIVGLSFAGSYNVRLLFSAVPALASIGLISTMSADPLIAFLFLIFVFAGSFMVVHEACLRAAAEAVAQGRSPGPPLLVGQIQTATVCTVAAALVGNLLATPMHTVGSQLVGTAIPLTVPVAVTAPRPTSTTTTIGNTSSVQVGTGPVTLSNQVLMRVQADHSAYWRSATFDAYTGRGWSSTLLPNYPLDRHIEPAQPMPNGAEPFPRSVDEAQRTEVNIVGGPSRMLHQRVRFESSALFSDIVAASEPRTLRVSQSFGQPSTISQFTMDEAGRIRIGNPGVRGMEYDVWSEEVQSTKDSLRRAGSDYPTEVSRLYLGLGDMSPQALDRVRAAATEATRGAQNSYDRVERLVQYISKQCAYNTSASVVPADRDVVDHFLFEAKEGYCDSFASALAVMCRSVGIPARAATGFVPGELDAATQWYIVRDKDRHLWTEVFFPGIGWVAFDATTDAVDRSPTQAGQGHQRPTLADLMLRRGWLPPLALAAFLCMLGYVLKVEVLDRLLARRRGVTWSSLPPTNERIARAYLASCQRMAQRVDGRAASQTPEEFALAVAPRLAGSPDAAAALERLTELATRYCYSGEIAPANAVALAAAEQKRLALALRRVPKQARKPRSAPSRA